MNTSCILPVSGARRPFIARPLRASRTLVAAGLSLLALSANAWVWTSTGSTGVMDETTTATDLLPGKVSLSETYATLRSSPSVSAAVLRYNVTAVFGHSYAFIPRLEVRFADTGATTRVLARLKSYDTTTGLTQTLATLDSNSFPAYASYQTQISCSTDNLPINEFDKKVYWVDVELSRTAASGTAGLAALRIDQCVW